MRISPRQILPGVIILGFIAGTMAFLAAPRTLTGNPTGPVPFVFPDQLGPYTGEDVIFCTGEQCARSYLRAELEQIAEEHLGYCVWRNDGDRFDSLVILNYTQSAKTNNRGD